MPDDSRPPELTAEELAYIPEYGEGDGWVRCDKCGAKAWSGGDASSGIRIRVFQCTEPSCRRRWAIKKGSIVELGTWEDFKKP